MKKKKKIAICHYKIGKTDGVSLEIIKRERMLKRMDYEVILVAGDSGFNEEDQKAHTIHFIPELDFDYPKGHSVENSIIDIEKIKINAFTGFALKNSERYTDENALFNDMDKVADSIRDQFLKIYDIEKFDYLFLHNIFSHGRHITAARAFHEIIERIDVRVIAVNHDFYESYEGRYTPNPEFPEVEKYLNDYFPPSFNNIRHVTINSLWKDLLSEKLNKKKVTLDNEIIVFPDTFEFDQEPWVEDNYNKDFREAFDIKNSDLVILQATRIVKRKAIELMIDLIAELNKRKRELIGKPLYNGNQLDQTSDILLAFAQKEEQDAIKYRKELIDLMERKKVNYKFMHEQIEHERTERKGQKIYRLWDAYVFADLVSYPSIWEGFGNQFLEAVFAKKPTVLFEYPVFVTDIKEEGQGYDYISLGSNKSKRPNDLAAISPKQLKKAADKTIKTLLDPQTPQALNKNFEIAQRYHGEKALEELLRKCLE